jgi:hypothetical protein
MSGADARVSTGWLALREPADAAARSRDLVEHVVRGTKPAEGWMIYDLGGGTGAMGRWLAPQLPGTQHWVVLDRDADLLEVATTDVPGRAADGSVVTVEAKRADITRLAPDELAGATLLTASALLDMLTEDELDRLVALCAGTRCPTLLTLSVVGHVELTPADPLDPLVAAAFDAHQRRKIETGHLLGPDAVARAVDGLAGLGAEVLVRPSPWRLGAAQSGLATEWFTGWMDAAGEQEPELMAKLDTYRHERLAQATAGRLAVTVGHVDLLALPRRAGRNSAR